MLVYKGGEGRKKKKKKKRRKKKRKKIRLRNRSVLFDDDKNLFHYLGDIDITALWNREMIYGIWGKHMCIFIKCEWDPWTSQEFK